MAALENKFMFFHSRRDWLVVNPRSGTLVTPSSRTPP
jgi:hypothetical protein